MKALELIQKLRDTENRMEAAKTKVAVYKSIAERTTASLSGDRVSGSSTLTAHEDAIIRLMEAEKKYDAVCIAYFQIVDEVINLINFVDGEERRMVAIDFFVNKERVTDIAKKRHLSARTVYRFYKEALSIMDQHFDPP